MHPKIAAHTAAGPFGPAGRRACPPPTWASRRALADATHGPHGAMPLLIAPFRPVPWRPHVILLTRHSERPLHAALPGPPAPHQRPPDGQVPCALISCKKGQVDPYSCSGYGHRDVSPLPAGWTCRIGAVRQPRMAGYRRLATFAVETAVGGDRFGPHGGRLFCMTGSTAVQQHWANGVRRRPAAAWLPTDLRSLAPRHRWVRR